MAFMEKLGSVAKNIGEMAGDAMEMAKIEAKQIRADAAYKEALKKIGEYYCEVYRAGGTVAPEIEETVKAAVENYDIVIEQQRIIGNIHQEKELEKMAEKEARKEERQAAKEAKKAERQAAKEAKAAEEAAESADTEFAEAEIVETEMPAAEIPATEFGETEMPAAEFAEAEPSEQPQP